MTTIRSNPPILRRVARRPAGPMARRLPGLRRAATFLIHRIADRVAESLDYHGRVVDLGCGTAPYRRTILEQADEYIGVDWTHSVHDQAQVDVFADLSGPVPIDSESADTVVSFQVMEHLPEPEAFLHECRRLLRPGGRLHLTVPFMWHVHEAPHDYYRYTRHGLDHLLAKAGFTDIVVRPYAGFWQTMVLKFNYHTLRYARGVFVLPFVPLWLIGQWLAPGLDRIDPNPQEATGYVVSAFRPQ